MAAVGIAEDLSGLVRVINHTDQAGIVAIEALDDSGTKYGPVRLFVGALGARHIDAAGLEAGDIRNGLVGSTGSGTGDWRLQLRSTLELEVLSYVHAPGGEDGLLSGMHDVVPRSGAGHRVTVFDPDRVPGAAADSDDGPGQVSQLRLINPGETAAAVTITGTDGDGEAPETAVRLSLAAGTSRTVTVPELEAGEAEGLSGALGDGAGRWHLEVRSDRRIQVMHLLSGPSGDVANLSTAPGAPGAGHSRPAPRRIRPRQRSCSGSTSRMRSCRGAAWPATSRAGFRGIRGWCLRGTRRADHEADQSPGVPVVHCGCGGGRGPDPEPRCRAYRTAVASSWQRAQRISRTWSSSWSGWNRQKFVFERHLSAQVVQARCVTCHVAGGVSGSTRLVFVPDTVADHDAVNRQAFATFLADVEEGADLILSKGPGGIARRRGAAGGRVRRTWPAWSGSWDGWRQTRRPRRLRRRRCSIRCGWRPSARRYGGRR